MVDDARLRLEVLLEISLTVGSDLALEPMLSSSLLVMMRRLDCTFGAVVVRMPEGEEVRVALPRAAPAVDVLAKLDAVQDERTPDGSVAQLDGRFFHRWLIPGYGTLTLGRQSPLPLALTFDFRAIMTRLSAAVSASLQNQSLVDATRALEESRQRWMFAVEGSGSGVCDWNPKTDFAVFSDRWFLILGYDPKVGWKSGREAANSLHPDVREVARTKIVDHFRTGAPFGMECQMQTADGAFVWVDVKGLAVHRDRDGRVDRMIWTMTDISRRKAAEIRLQQERNVLRTLVDNLPDLVWITDREGRHLMCNPRTLSLYGLQEPDVIGKSVQDLAGQGAVVAETDLPTLGLLDSFERRSFEADVVFATDGHKESLEVTLVELRDAEGAVTGSLGIAHDVTLRKAYHAQLLRSNEEMESAIRDRTAELEAAKAAAEAASRAKSIFLANMSHEFRTPLHGILGTVQLIRDVTEDSDPARFHMDRVERSARHLLGVINEVLDVSQIESGRTAIHDETFTARRIVDTLESIFRDKADMSGIEFQIRAPTEILDVLLRADVVKIEQILTNLVGNAIKFTDHGHVVARFEVDRRSAPNCRMRVEVEDSGIGIPASAQPRLFNAFEQVDSGVARKYGGSGLGLHISQRFAQLLGGTLTFESEEGKGSNFRLDLPVVEVVESLRDDSGNEDSEASVDALLGRHAGCDVLVVDDDEIGRFVVSEFLAARGFNVREAAGGEVARTLGKLVHFDIIFMDMQMPDVDGLAVTRSLRSEGPNVDTPIVALTANALSGDRAICLEAGMNDFLSKPLEWSELARVMDRLLGGFLRGRATTHVDQ